LAEFHDVPATDDIAGGELFPDPVGQWPDVEGIELDQVARPLDRPANAERRSPRGSQLRWPGAAGNCCARSPTRAGMALTVGGEEIVDALWAVRTPRSVDLSDERRCRRWAQEAPSAWKIAERYLAKEASSTSARSTRPD
jgi:hypothetical protein